MSNTAALLIMLVAQNAWAQALSIESKTVNGHKEIVLHNASFSPLSVKLTLPSSNNVANTTEWPIITSVQPYSDMHVADLYANDRRQGFSYSMTSEYIQGDLHATPDTNVLYRLPYRDGLGFYISQSADGPKTTHTQPESFYAIDFTMPEGTPIVAARDGVVIKTEAGFYDGGNLPALAAKANIVKILHDDGSIAGYAHLRYGGVTVHEGDKVKAGDVIGLSGSTGYSTGPHLHFAVVKVAFENNKFVEKSLPIKLYVGKPALTFMPKMGLYAIANYSEPVSLPKLKTDSTASKSKRAGYWPFVVIPLLFFIFLLYIRVKTEKQQHDKLMDEIKREYDQYNS